MESWHPRLDIEQEEIDHYAALVVAYVKETKGWEPGEYRMRFVIALADAPYAIFHVTHNKAIEEIRRAKPTLGVHPLEFDVYVQTEEMRAFDDYKEFADAYQKIREKKKGGKP